MRAAWIVALGLALVAPTALAAEAPYASLPMSEAAPLLVVPAHPLLLDVREPDEYAQGHVPGALNVPLSQVADWAEREPRDQPLFVICHSGRRSLKATRQLAGLGFTRVTNVEGGFQAWRARGLAIETPVATP